MYESPINIITSKLCTQLESDCVKSVQSYGFDVDKEELAKALNYDRKQYEKGHTDGDNKAIDDFIRKCEMESRVSSDEITHLSYYGLSMRELQRIAEQLKEGENINE